MLKAQALFPSKLMRWLYFMDDYISCEICNEELHFDTGQNHHDFSDDTFLCESCLAKIRKHSFKVRVILMYLEDGYKIFVNEEI